MCLLTPGSAIFIAGPPIGAVTPPGQKSDHFVLVQVHVADVFVVLLVVIVEAAGFALGHGPRPLSVRLIIRRDGQGVKMPCQNRGLQLFNFYT